MTTEEEPWVSGGTRPSSPVWGDGIAGAVETSVTRWNDKGITSFRRPLRGLGMWPDHFPGFRSTLFRYTLGFTPSSPIGDLKRRGVSIHLSDARSPSTPRACEQSALNFGQTPDQDQPRPLTNEFDWPIIRRDGGY